MDYEDLLKMECQTLRHNLNVMKKNPIRNRFAIKKASFKIQALEEAQRNILTTSITCSSQGKAGSVLGENNYATYSAQVAGAYDMYDNQAKYGGEVYKALIDSRAAFIGGEGISITSTEKAQQEWINGFLKINKLNGSRLVNALITGELEGKLLFKLTQGKHYLTEEKYIKARVFSWHKNQYTVMPDEDDTDIIKSITYGENKEVENLQSIDPKKAVFIKLAGKSDDINECTNRGHCILNECEGLSRSKYDLRKSNHLYGRAMQIFETKEKQEAKVIKAELMSDDAGAGDTYAGPAKVYYIEPSGDANDALLKEQLNNMRIISFMLSIPVHFLAYPDLMSNRATADNLNEVVVNGTRLERMIYEEKLYELIYKAMQMAVNANIAPNAILKGDFQVKLPVISIAQLQQIMSIWFPLMDEGLISKFNVLNRLPGVNPSEEMKLIEKERKEAAKNSALNNLSDDALSQEENLDNQEDMEDN